MVAASSARENEATEAGERVRDADALVLRLLRLARLVRQVSDEDGLESAAYFPLMWLVANEPQRTTSLAEAVHSAARPR